MASTRTAYALFCDDIRREVGGKHSFIGVYSRHLILAKRLPVVIPKLGIVTWLTYNVADRPVSAAVTVYAPPDRQSIYHRDITQIVGFSQEAREKVENGSVTRVTFRLLILITPIRIAAPGFLEVTVETEQGMLRAGRLEMRVSDAAVLPEPANEAG